MSAKQGSLSWKEVKCELCPWIFDAVDAQGFELMTPVQASTIPLFTGNKDVVVEAVTGSGKTLSFVIPILQRLCRNTEPVKRGHVFAMVISPTRELALQINAVFKSVLEYYPEDEELKKQLGLPSRVATQAVIGSLTSLQEDLQTFLDERPQIIVGTPGKLLEFLSHSSVKTKEFDCLVLDEADRLLDVSFELTIREIVRHLPRQKRVGLFSATIASAGDMIFKIGLANPVKIAVKSKNEMNAAPKALSIKFLVLKPEQKIKALFALLASLNFNKAIVYFPTCISVTYFYAMFNNLMAKASSASEMKNALKFFSIHGKLQLKPRMRTLESFTANTIGKSVLMATDVAARGIDIPDVDLVIQMDPPTDPDVFLHRCGRTGRANKVGKALVFLNEGREEDYVDFMRVKKIDMEPEIVQDVDIDLNKLDSRLSSLYGFKSSFNKIVEKWMLEDRARYDLSVRSYVGFVRYYSKHSALSIFRLESMDYIGLAKAYGLIRLPRMPETKYIDSETMPKDGWLITKDFDINSYKYANEQKEAERLKQLANVEKKQLEKQKKRENRKINESWSNQTNAKEARGVRREINKRKREAFEKEIKEKAAAGESSEEEIEEDWKDIVRNKKKKKQSGAISGSFEGL